MIGSTNPRLGGRCENAGIFGKLKVFLAALPKAVTGAEVGERRFRTLLLIVPWLVLAASPDRGSGQNNPGDFFTGFTATADGETTVTLSWSFTQLAVSGTIELEISWIAAREKNPRRLRLRSQGAAELRRYRAPVAEGVSRYPTGPSFDGDALSYAAESSDPRCVRRHRDDHPPTDQPE